MLLRIISDGTSAGTRVETQDGELVQRVQRVDLVLTATALPQAVLYLEAPLINLDLTVETQTITEAQDAEHDPDLQRTTDRPQEPR